MIAASESVFRPTFAIVDLDALARNFHTVKKRIPAGCGIMAMVKADAYGHGAVPVSKVLEACGVSALGVATVEEGTELREAGVRSQILVMGGLMGVGSPASLRMVEAGLTPVIHSASVLDSLEAAAVKFSRDVPVHLKVDTGMSRLGVRPESLGHLVSKLRACRHIAVEGVMTHLADSTDMAVTTQQMDLFLASRKVIEAELGEIKVWHAANSGAVLRDWGVEVPGVSQLWVRPGLALYGACKCVTAGDELRPVMGLVSRVVLIKRVPEGTKVSYGGRFTTKRQSRLAIVPIGYADGYPLQVSGRACVLVRGRRVPVVGSVTMDMIILDVTDLEGIGVNDEVVLLGRQGSEQITIFELAEWAGTITYEILCRVSKRMPRIYKPWSTSLR